MPIPNTCIVLITLSILTLRLHMDFESQHFRSWPIFRYCYYDTDMRIILIWSVFTYSMLVSKLLKDWSLFMECTGLDKIEPGSWKIEDQVEKNSKSYQNNCLSLHVLHTSVMFSQEVILQAALVSCHIHLLVLAMYFCQWILLSFFSGVKK